ncbi:MAG: repeat-like protein [Phycisphaerales bacterium]|nr:repeat-like protein [Phycisphaerales bacterium]
MTTPVSSVPTRTKFSDWLGLVFAAVMWAIFLIGWGFDIQSFVWFLATLAVYLVMTLLFLVWWFTRRSFTWSQRLMAFASALVLGVLAGYLSAHAIRPPIYLGLFGLPIVLGIWSAWVLATSRRVGRVRLGGLIACLMAAWGLFLLIRVNGLQGNMRADIHWRWTPTADELFLAEHSTRAAATMTLPAGRRLELRPGDWPGFRGPDRDGAARGLSIALDWPQSSPTILWRQRVGPAWSSMAIVDGCVFTQEQRGEREAVVCRDALTGREIWVHDEPARFEEATSGPGPRATPTFAGGRIYAQGALGTLNCLDAASGRLIWSRDLRADAGAALPLWGFSNSPLVTGDRVIVFAGGEGKKGLLAYSLDGGPPLWTADAGKASYASPQPLDLGAERQVLIFANEGLFAIDPATGRIRWQFPIERAVGVPSVLQACRVSPDSLALGNGAVFGVQRVQVSSDGRSATRAWATPRVKPAFSDMVYHNGCIYGFDGTVFCCVDASSGERKWRDGRYGAGQVLLLADQGVMIVTSEDGQAILLRCNPQRNEELGRVQAVSGKTWNHAAVAQDRLFVRSDGEMACIQLRAIGRR